jgi:hypothetical protein
MRFQPHGFIDLEGSTFATRISYGYLLPKYGSGRTVGRGGNCDKSALLHLPIEKETAFPTAETRFRLQKNTPALVNVGVGKGGINLPAESWV